MTKAVNQGQAAYASPARCLPPTDSRLTTRVLETKEGIVDLWRTNKSESATITADLGEHYSITDTGFKYYSAGYPINSPIYGGLQLMKEHQVAADDISAIRVGMTPASAEVVDNRAMPSICLLSLALGRGRLGYDDAHDESNLRRPDVRRLRGTIEFVRDASFPADAAQRRVSWVETTTVEGGPSAAPTASPLATGSSAACLGRLEESSRPWWHRDLVPSPAPGSSPSSASSTPATT